MTNSPLSPGGLSPPSSPASAPPTLNPRFLPDTPLYGQGEGVGWDLSPRPYRLTSEQGAVIDALGEALWAFQGACDRLYADSLAERNGVPRWISGLLDQGKPADLLAFAQMKRFRGQAPLTLRPDLLVTESGFALTELDAVPGGLGFTAALNEAYRQSGFDVLEAPYGGLPGAFSRMLGALRPDQSHPAIAITLSDEAEDYRAEMTWLSRRLQAEGARIETIHPRQLRLVRDHLVWADDSGLETPIHIVYRFFELFDLPNIPNGELLRFAVKKGLAACTPPFRPHFEEKLWLALAHHPCLQAHWRALLGERARDLLWAMIPPGWVLDPAPISPQAVIPGLMRDGAPIQAFSQLADASQRERRLVIKPSGFSPLAWGSRGVSVGHDLPAALWGERLAEALRAFGRTPYLMQAFIKPAAREAQRLNLASGAVETFSGRTRLCPYYFASPQPQGGASLTLAGALATTCPADKKVIHGMRDAILAPVIRAESGA